MMVIIHTHHSVPEMIYICFTPNTTTSPANICINSSNRYTFMNQPQNILIALFLTASSWVNLLYFHTSLHWHNQEQGYQHNGMF